MKDATLKDVAEAAGIHYSTASRALDPNKQDLVSESTVSHVQDVARKLGYKRHMAARNLRTGRSETIGIVIPDLSNPFWAPVLHGVSRALEEEGYVALIGETHDDKKQHWLLLDRLAAWRVDAVISGAARLDEEKMLARFACMRVPILLMVRATSAKLPYVVDDGRAGGGIAARHLIELGHRVVAQLAGPQDISSFVLRRRGFVEFSTTVKGVTVIEFDEAGTAPSYAEGRRLMKALLQRDGLRPTAIFAHNDLMAIGAIDALKAAGLRCPHDISVIGYNDSPLVDHVSPSLSTLRVPMDQLGYLAGRKTIELLQNPRLVSAPRCLMPELVQRGSTDAVRVLPDLRGAETGRPRGAA